MTTEKIINKFIKSGYKITKVLGSGNVVVIGKGVYSSYNAAYNAFFKH